MSQLLCAAKHNYMCSHIPSLLSLPPTTPTPVFPLLGIYLREMKMYVHKVLYVPTSYCPSWKRPKGASVGKWKNENVERLHSRLTLSNKSSKLLTYATV